MVTAGPGLTHVVTGMSGAFLSNSPCIFLSPASRSVSPVGDGKKPFEILDIAVNGLLNVLDLCRKKRVKNFYLASSEDWTIHKCSKSYSE